MPLPTPDTPCFLCGRGAGDGRLPSCEAPIPACLRRSGGKGGAGVLLAAHPACFRAERARRVREGLGEQPPPEGAGPWLIS